MNVKAVRWLVYDYCVVTRVDRPLDFKFNAIISCVICFVMIGFFDHAAAVSDRPTIVYVPLTTSCDVYTSDPAPFFATHV